MDLKGRISRSLTTVSGWIPPGIFPHLVRRELISIFYHAVSDSDMPHVRHLYPVVPVHDFEAALGYLQANFTLVSYAQVHDHATRGTPLPQGAVHLSFDDGFAQCYHVVRPILSARKVPCTFFLTTEWLDNHKLWFRHQISRCVHQAEGLTPAAQESFLAELNRLLDLSLLDMVGFKAWLTAFRSPDDHTLGEVSRLLGIDSPSFLEREQPYLTTAQVQQMHAEGFTIGGHGVSHRKLGFIPENQIESEIVGSCLAVQAITGQQIVPFSFPQSAGNVSRKQLAEILQKHPFIGLLFDTKDLRLDESFMVNRVWAERPLTPERVLHPVPEVLEHAYRDAWLESVFRRLRKD